ncbi:ABC transporter ATP-binding protein [Glycomyces sp. TRM65418]|uniref:ABC transporter ATP-binding protein n=1 Tax=Glycomyces sp. TRM65418 TaxID=2867006 RepID=UPI001CE70E21|nr:ABC transporter ATP-binding protein [Glycomyces sp. TRM65418]MCC3764633.1 ABC transporter ATP-binding protein [Glycomyces sp. TRM65418]QZD54296.1 ABC transporter ATP-binding protein [Glycomyces sp. TRM65418]
MKIAIKDVSIDLGGRRVVDRVSLEVASGGRLALLGPNGSGKSTLLRSLYRLHRPASGTVLVGGDDLWRLSARASAQRVAVVAQESAAEHDLTAFQVVMLGRVPHQRGFGADGPADLAAAEAALGRVGALDLADRPFAVLSGGEKQRILLARAITQDCPVLVLDEPTNHLDVTFQLELMQLVADLGLTTIAALHDLNLAVEYCDRVAVLQDGRLIASGDPDDVLTADLIAEAFAVRADRLAHPATGRPHFALSPLEPERNTAP